MKNSVRTRLALIMMALTAGTFIASITLNSLFLKKYYMATKTETLHEVYEQLQKVADDIEPEQSTDIFPGGGGSLIPKDDLFSDYDWKSGQQTEEGGLTAMSSLDDEVQSALDQMCETYGVTLIMVNSSGKYIYSYGAGEMLSQRLTQMYLSGNVEYYEDADALETTVNYTLNLITDSINSRQYLEMHGVLKQKDYFVLRLALESIEESAAISNRFYGIVCVVMIALSSIVMWIAAKSFTQPIHELAGIAENMSNLNFDVKYTGKQQDEINLLGTSMNRLSEALEETISKLKAANLELQNDIANKVEIDEMRQEFISNVSHELKTPIALIQGYAEGLKDSVIEDDESKKFYCEVIIDEAGKMDRMVRELLALNQVETGQKQLNIERFDLTDTINNVLQASSLVIQQKEIKVIFHHEEPIYVWADPYEVEQVINNYVSNAMNHIRGDKVMKLTVEEKENTVRVSVYNTGDHIPEEDLDRIWEKFYKVDKARTREYGGNGIGLSIVRAIMESMHQSYGVENVPGGVMFWFEVDKTNR